MREDLYAAAVYLKNRPDCTGKLGAVGFASAAASSMAWRCAYQTWRRRCPTAPSRTRGHRKIKALINAQYGELTRALPGMAASTPNDQPASYEGHIYPGRTTVYNDTTPRYDEAAAKEAWQHALDGSANI